MVKRLPSGNSGTGKGSTVGNCAVVALAGVGSMGVIVETLIKVVTRS